MTDRKIEKFSVSCLQINNTILKTQIFVRSVFYGSPSTPCKDHFKKFARLGTSLLISDATKSISATMRGKRISGDREK